MPLSRPDIYPDILAEHLEELDGLWERRESVLFSPEWTLNQLEDLERRADAHLDGLRIGGQHTFDLAFPLLAGDDAGLARAAVFALLSLEDSAVAERVVRALGEATLPAARGIRDGLRHSPVALPWENLLLLATEGTPLARALAGDVLAFHRRTPLPQRFDELISPAAFEAPENADVLALAIEAAGRMSGLWERQAAERAFAHPTRTVRRAGLVASARAGVGALPRYCRDALKSGNACDPEFFSILAVVGDPSDLSIFQQHLGNKITASAAVTAIGVLGSAAGVPLLIEAMRNEALAPAAGAAFRRITGIDLDLASPQPPREASAEEVDAHDDTPVPDPEQAAANWKDRSSSFSEGERYQEGVDCTKLDFGARFQTFSLAIRRDLVLRESWLRPEVTPPLEIEARAALQRR